MCGSNLKTFIPFGRLPSHFYDFFPQSDLMSNCQASLCVFCPFLFGKQQGEDGRDKVSNENHVSDLTKSEDVLLGSRVNFFKKIRNQRNEVPDTSTIAVHKEHGV